MDARKLGYFGEGGAPDGAAQALLPGFSPPPAEEEENDSRFTLRSTLEWCKRAAGVDAFDLDVAACAEAYCAPRYYTVKDDGLRQPWDGRVWCNPPYSDIAPWVRRACQQMERPECRLVAMLIPATRADQSWWQREIEPFRDGRGNGAVRLSTHFLPGRQAFGMPGNPTGVGVGSPPFGCVLLVWRE